ncbi:MAG: M23 family metallopeptidase [Microbacteriaceae bacterium]|nr:M23 family metallopeptidase [Microbacteriaceae bacterium]
MTTDSDSARSGADDESRAQNPDQPLARREMRLRAEQEKVAQIARERERERIREAAMKRAAEIRRQKEEAEARESEAARFQNQINNSQQVPTLPRDEASFPPALSGTSSAEPSLTGATSDSAVVPSSYAERGHVGAQRRKRAEEKARKKEEAVAKRSSRAKKPQRRTHPLRNALGRSFVVMVVGGLFAVLALPATGFNATNMGWAAETRSDDQEVKVAALGTEAEKVALGDYSVTTYSELLLLTYGRTSGFAYSVTNSGNIRWPFPVVVPISSGYGGRAAPCLGCSTQHRGLDFDPATGTPFGSVAAGTVVEVNDDGYLGKWVVISHNVDGLKFKSLYAHMIRDSIGVKLGQEVKAGDYIGRVGDSGVTSGAHLHLAILIDESPVDPFTFLKKHTKGN